MAKTTKTKKELDKDVMYSKLMPSIPRVEDEEEPVGLPPAASAETKAEPSANDVEISGLSMLRNRLFEAQSDFQTTNDAPVQLVNLMEDLIVTRLDDAFAKFNCCQCDHCRKDVVAIALNKLPSRYAVGTAQQLRQMAETIPTKEISSALVHAILRVRANPRH